MIVAVRALVQLVLYALVIAVVWSLLSHVVYGNEPVRVTLSSGGEIVGESSDTGDPERLWFPSRGEVTTLFRSIGRDQVAHIVPLIPAKPPPVTVEHVLRHYRVPTVAELVRKAFLGELKPADVGT